MKLPVNIQLPPKLKKVLPWVYVPVGYVFLFCMFAYMAFPYERLEQRIVLGYNNSQKDSPEPKRMEIGDLTWSWRFPGVVLTDVELIGPKPPPPKDGSEAPPQEHVHIDQIYAGVSPLSMLFGTTAVQFEIEGFGGEMSGSYESSAELTKVSAELSDIDPGQVPGVTELLQMPLAGALSGSVAFELPEGKYGEASGEVDLEIADLRIADGKTKIRGMLALPEVNAGTLVVQATASEGRVEFEEFQTKGPDLEASAEGKLRLRDPLSLSTAESLTLAFKFSDAYRDKDDSTRSLLGKPGDKLGGLIDMSPQSKKAKQEDGSYKWRVLGSFNRLSFTPAVAARGGAAKPARGRAGAQPPRPTKP